LALIISRGQDDTLNQRPQDPPRSEQIIKRSERPDLRPPGRRVQVRPHRRDHQVAAIGQHQDQLQSAATAHPAQQLKRPALPRMTRPQNPDCRREAIEVGLVSCLPSPALTITG
jgi:hypothetical protein